MTTVTDRAWNGDASRFTDTQYKAACVLDKGASAGDTVKQRYALPVREPDGTINRNGVHAAAQRLASVKAPAAAKAAAARKLLALYSGPLAETAPASLKDAAQRSAVEPHRELRAAPLADGSAERQGDEIIFRGYAAVYDQPSVPMLLSRGQQFTERNAPGAFEGILATNPDVRALGMNHDRNHVLARTKSGTLTLESDSRGLQFEARAADTEYAREIAAGVNRGDIDAMSYGFVCGDDTWDESDPGNVQRTIRSYSALYDVSPVTFAAFTQTAVSLRSLGERLTHGDLSEGELRAIVQLNVWTDDDTATDGDDLDEPDDVVETAAAGDEPVSGVAGEPDPGYRAVAQRRELRRRLLKLAA